MRFLAGNGIAKRQVTCKGRVLVGRAGECLISDRVSIIAMKTIAGDWNVANAVTRAERKPGIGK